MPIASTDLLVRLSIKTGTAGNQNAQPDPNASLGRYVSTTNLVDATLHNLFDVVSGDENAALDVEYRCIFIVNNHATLTWIAPKLWISDQVLNGANADIGLDPTAASALGATAAQAVEVANEGTAPTGVTFSAPTTKATGLSLGDIPPVSCRAVWVRRTATNSAAQSLDGVTLSFEGDTDA